MWNWLKKLFRREEVEMQEDDYNLWHKIGKKKYPIPNRKTMYGKIEFENDIPVIKYYKRTKPGKKDYGLK